MIDQVLTESASVDYTDSDGIKRRVMLPVGVTAYEEGIPLSLDVDRLYGDTPLSFRRRLVEELWARGLIEPCHYTRAGAPELLRAAISSAIKADTLDILTLAKSECRRS